MKRPLKYFIVLMFVILTAFLIETSAQPTLTRESLANLRVLEDNSIELIGTWSKPIRPWEMGSYLGRGIPLSSNLVYVGNFSMHRRKEGDKLRGKLVAIIYPRLNPREVRPDIIKEYQVRGLLSRSRIVDLLSILYGEDLLVYYGIESELRDVNISSAIYGNFTVTTLELNATVESSANLIKSINLSFFALRISEELYVITYLINLTTFPLTTSKEKGLLTLDLEPIVEFFPPDTVTNLKISLNESSSLVLVGSDPAPAMLAPHYAEIIYVPIDEETVVLYLDKVETPLILWVSIFLSGMFVTIAAGMKYFKKKL